MVGRGGIVAWMLALAALALADMVGLGSFKSQAAAFGATAATGSLAFLLYLSGIVSLSLDLPTTDEASARVPQQEKS